MLELKRLFTKIDLQLGSIALTKGDNPDLHPSH